MHACMSRGGRPANGAHEVWVIPDRLVGCSYIKEPARLNSSFRLFPALGEETPREKDCCTSVFDSYQLGSWLLPYLPTTDQPNDELTPLRLASPGVCDSTPVGSVRKGRHLGREVR